MHTRHLKIQPSVVWYITVFQKVSKITTLSIPLKFGITVGGYEKVCGLALCNRPRPRLFDSYMPAAFPVIRYVVVELRITASQNVLSRASETNMINQKTSGEVSFARIFLENFENYFELNKHTHMHKRVIIVTVN